MSVKKAIYAGTFDPIHNGHIDVIERASKMFDEVIVVLAVNSKKTHLFSEDERIMMTRDALSQIKNVNVMFYSGLIANLANETESVALIRGLRTVTDFEYELQIALMNRKLSDIPTIFMMPHEKYSYLTSSIIRELSRYNQDVSEFVTPLVSRMLKEK
mgnify:FL=1